MRYDGHIIFICVACCIVAFKLGQIYVETGGTICTHQYKEFSTTKQVSHECAITTKVHHARNQSCDMEFIKYIPSALEQTWSAEVNRVASNEHTWKLGCEMLNNDLVKVQELLSAIGRYELDPSSANLSSSYTSALEFRDSCTGRQSFVHIEPLVSFLRHPLAFCQKIQMSWFMRLFGNKKDFVIDMLFDKNYLIVPYKDEVTNDESTKWLFDAGASTYDAGAGGASQSWFVNTYRARGIEFDRIIGWEAAKTDPSNQWDGVPEEVKRKTSWFNIPVTTGVGDADNPLTFIKHLTKPEDFVVFKLDIDSPLVEIALVQQLMADPQLLELVDEFYFEHHVSGSPMQWNGWGDLRKSDAELSTLQESYELFTFLRQHGVRAHSWV